MLNSFYGLSLTADGVTELGKRSSPWNGISIPERVHLGSGSASAFLYDRTGGAPQCQVRGERRGSGQGLQLVASASSLN
jgi:hypothetical protein